MGSTQSDEYIKGIVKKYLIYATEYLSNDLLAFKGEERLVGERLFERLTVRLTELFFDVRYCPRNYCKCSPEYRFKSFIEQHYEELKKYDRTYADELIQLAVKLYKLNQYS